MRQTTKQDYIKILMEDRFNDENVQTTDDDLALLNSMSVEQLRMMVKQTDDFSEEVDNNYL